MVCSDKTPANPAQSDVRTDNYWDYMLCKFIYLHTYICRGGTGLSSNFHHNIIKYFIKAVHIHSFRNKTRHPSRTK